MLFGAATRDCSSHVHVLVDYETTWYGSDKAAYDLAANGGIGEIRKVIARDGHRGPKLIGVQREFFAWLTDPKLNGAGALYDFGCYGADLMTWLLHGEAPQSVSAVTEQLQPSVYPKVDDEAGLLLTYRNAIAIVQGSWNWPFDVKDMDVYGRTGSVKTIKRERVEVRLENEAAAHTEVRMVEGILRHGIREGDIYSVSVIDGELAAEPWASGSRATRSASEIQGYNEKVAADIALVRERLAAWSSTPGRSGSTCIPDTLVAAERHFSGVEDCKRLSRQSRM